MGLNTSNKIKFKDALEMVKYELLAQEEGVVKQVPTLAGKPGIGKTESLKALAKNLGYELIVTQLSAVAPEEFSGIPDFIDAPEDFAKKYSTTGADKAKFTRWSIPELVATANYRANEIKKKGGKGIVILFDDIHAADPALERYMFNLFLDKTVGQYRLADNVLVCAAMNDSDEAGFRGFNAAVLDRLAIYSVDFDFDSWYKIMNSKLDHVIAAYLRNHKERVLGEECVDKVTPSPRSWTELSNLIKFMRSKNINVNNNILNTAARARVGEEVAAELVKFNSVYEKFDFENLIKQPVEKIELPTDMVEQIIFAGIVRYVKNKKDGEKIIKLIEKYRDKKLFVSELINETAVLFGNSHFKKNEGIKVIANWIIDTDDKEISEAFKDLTSCIVL